MPAPFPEAGIAPVVFTIDDLPAARRPEAWNAAFGTLNAIEPALAPGVPVGARSENWLLDGGMVLGVTRVSPARFLRDPLRARRDSLDHWGLRVLRRGQGRLRHASFEARVLPGELHLFSLHENWVADWDLTEWVSLCIPRDLHPQLSMRLGTVPLGPLRGAAAGLLADLLLALPARLATARPEEMPLLAEAIRGAVAACLPGGALPDVPAELAKERVRRAMLRHIGSARLTPARLAAAAGLSRSVLYRLFEAEGGVARVIRDLRLSLAHAALRDPALAGQSIAALAEAHGFPDPSTFTRAFRQAYGATPGEVRAMGQPGPAPPRLAPALPPGMAAGDLAARLYGAAAGRATGARAG